MPNRAENFRLNSINTLETWLENHLPSMIHSFIYIHFSVCALNFRWTLAKSIFLICKNIERERKRTAEKKNNESKLLAHHFHPYFAKTWKVIQIHWAPSFHSLYFSTSLSLFLSLSLFSFSLYLPLNRGKRDREKKRDEERKSEWKRERAKERKIEIERKTIATPAQPSHQRIKKKIWKRIVYVFHS